MTRCVVIEAPLEHRTWREPDNLRYLGRCILDSVRREESPYSSVRMLVEPLDDARPEERILGMRMGWAMAVRMDGWVFYLDRGVSPGMLGGLRHALEIREDLPSKRQRIEFRAFGALALQEISIERWHAIRRWDADPSSHADRSSTIAYARAFDAFPELGDVFRSCCPELVPA